MAETKTEGAAEKTKETYKNARNIMDVIKLVSGLGSSVGDIFISAPIFIVVAHAEWLFSMINPDYQLQWWKKALVVVVDFIIAVILLNAIVLIAIIVDCDIRGQIVGAMVEGSSGWSFLGWLADWVTWITC